MEELRQLLVLGVIGALVALYVIIFGAEEVPDRKTE